MNAVLVYPLEALAFDYLSFGFFSVINSVWTWVAVITAAVSLWRIKTFSTLPIPEPRGDFFVHAPSPYPPRKTVVTSSSSSSSSQVERVSSDELASNESSFAALGNEEGAKGKLAVYFKQDDGGECDGDEDGDEEGEHDGVELSKEWFEYWEKLLKMRKGETGWYCYQDMKVIDGSVVRLWDGCRRRRNAEATTFSVGIITTW
ncbi:hypothetical protein K7X08_012013 [Anisodus acutangulus]|uniref:Uncharacterized protein n=1 Tax=Anisodus acutangulus TaxID=402998 RepID=A0A9Q1LDB6_9SOLA|nr:hypothetical protein K7X08_012013 [Anisodus acutangulus]